MSSVTIVTALAAWLAAGPGTDCPGGQVVARPVAADLKDRSPEDRVAQVLAGLPGATDPRARQVRPGYARRVNRAFARFETRVAAPMRAWAEQTLAQVPGETVFYPFAGADFPSAHRLYPDAGRYVLVAMQRGGPPPDLDGLDRATLAATLVSYERLLGGFLGRGFFITAEMNAETKGDAAVVPGITGALMVFAAREGFEVVALEPVRVAADGAVELHPGDRRRPSTWESVRLRLRRDGRPVVLEYLRVGLSNFNLTPDSPALALMTALAQGRVILKAASHLPQTREFSVLTQLLLRRAPTIVQDETGVAYDALTGDFAVELHGSFRRVNELFTPTDQAALIAAYAGAGVARPLPFHVGYRKGTEACMLVATRSGTVKSAAR